MSDTRSLIRSKVKQALASSSTTPDDRRAAEQGLLPLFDDLAYRYYLRDDGSVFIIDALEPEAGLQEMTDATWRLVVLRAVVAEESGLESLIPPQPPGTVECSECAGTGRRPVVAIGGTRTTSVCLNCRGTGWIGVPKAAV
jgi:hypothetical protein